MTEPTGSRAGADDAAEDAPAARLRQFFFRIVAGVLAGLVLPLAALTLFFHFRFTAVIEDSSKLTLAAFSESLANTIDLFVEERIVNLFSLFHSSGFGLSPTDADMRSFLRRLTRMSESFVDVCFVGPGGRVIGSAGPPAPAPDDACGGEDWTAFMDVTAPEYRVGDICRGPDDRAYVPVAVRQSIDGRPYALRSMVALDSLTAVLRKTLRGNPVDFGLSDANGGFWSGPSDPERLAAAIRSFRPSEAGAGVVEARVDGSLLLTSMTRIDAAPWTLWVSRNVSEAGSDLYHANRMTTASLLLILLGVSGALIFITMRFVRHAQRAAEKKAQLRHQLIHASKLASVGELATGIAHEINNPLAVITATSGVIEDMLDPQFGLEAGPDAILKEVKTIEAAAFRARGITRQLLDFGRKNEPTRTPCDLNALLRDILGGLKQKAFSVANIAVELHLQPDLPDIPADPDQLRQVFLNLLNNAGDAISGPGAITVTTRSDGGRVEVIVRDTGEGMTAEQLQRIFDPFFTTKEVGKGTGLGLSISLNIVESFGGRIEVESRKGEGSVFTVSFPAPRPD